MFAFINSIVRYFIRKNMTIHFVYMWFDKNRKMFYIGQHSGTLDDKYTSSSRWLAGEIKYRPDDFKRRIIKTFNTKNEAQKYEGYLLTLIEDNEWGRKYYNTKQGKPKGVAPWNKGKRGSISELTRKKLSDAKKGNPSNRGKKFPKLEGPNNVMNRPEQRKRMSELAKKRRKFVKPDGSWTWIYVDDCLGNKEQPSNPHSLNA